MHGILTYTVQFISTSIYSTPGVYLLLKDSQSHCCYGTPTVASCDHVLY